MIEMHELRMGDLLLVQFDGTSREGEIIGLDREERKTQVQTDVQDFWYDPNELYPIPLDENQLLKFGFEKQDQPGGGVKYLKGPFRILISGKGNFSDFEMWYREDRRHITQPIAVHQLQNHYHGMTKIDLIRAVSAH
ncbi:hypothetical protein [Puia dinghuensis]|uniref:Uncharacterized protein n=1 Tax=Puia dinghuensis TaxID=1792502 RepID=A0A8J2XRY7_9BACT|nr:hypothetical protein [Puia dinghuensis]GGA91042.1 hypothetical protein GCM10011511_12940 [Puia dinghuensis]